MNEMIPMIPTMYVLMKKTVRAFYFVELGSQTRKKERKWREKDKERKYLHVHLSRV